MIMMLKTTMVVTNLTFLINDELIIETRIFSSLTGSTITISDHVVRLIARLDRGPEKGVLAGMMLDDRVSVARNKEADEEARITLSAEVGDGVEGTGRIVHS